MLLGDIVTCHPTEGERYYLRLLMSVRGPKSYEDLLECMFEAASYQMPSNLRQLFAMLLIYCNPTNPRELWEIFESPMFEDFKKSSN
ncbi:hypothetical protein H5410_043656 [Solanum commersonii]|uniref:Uncharacterized protein n=1 Tax=Solanum commersonii TaxID=4109 RepID=A0A9J5Y1Z5_SOLCO|nr:hypothetical protein H5410_043656 [Solanum commersonii]